MNNDISVMLSIHPEYCQLIVSGKKTVEVRKTIPKTPTPFKVYIYCTLTGPTVFSFGEKANGKVIGEFVCDEIVTYPYERFNDGEHYMPFGDLEKTCLDGFEIYNYLNTQDGYGWHISELVIYEKPKKLSAFMKTGALSYEEWLHRIYNGSGLLELRYENYLKNFELLRPPQSWCYVQEKGD